MEVQNIQSDSLVSNVFHFTVRKKKYRIGRISLSITEDYGSTLWVTETSTTHNVEPEKSGTDKGNSYS